MMKRLVCMVTVFALFATIFPSLAIASVPDTWHQRSPMPTGNGLEKIAFLNGGFVAVGDGGTILTSSDGDSWVSQSSGAPDNQLLSVSYGGGLYVAVGTYGKLLTSSDGVVWTTRTLEMYEDLHDVVYTGSQFVVAGNEGTILTSSDGVSWMSQTSGTSKHLNGIAYGNGLLVAVGASGTILTSVNGTDWTVGNSGKDFFTGVEYGNGTFVAVGFAGVIHSSVDGASWKHRNSGTFNSFQDISFANSQFLATGFDGTIVVSPNGTDWIARTSLVTHTLLSVAYGFGEYIAVGAAGLLLASEDGVSWTVRNSGAPNEMRSVAYGNGVFVAVGSGGAYLHSTDGTFWTGSAWSDPYQFNGVAYGNGIFVMVGYAGSILISVDGMTWAKKESGTTTVLRGVAIGDGKFVVVGDGGTILTSDDGLAWESQSSGSSNSLSGVISDGADNFVAVGYAGTVLKSGNGISWTNHTSTSATTESLTGVAYGNGFYVAVGLTGTIVTSGNGVDWTLRSSGFKNFINGIGYDSGVFVAAGGVGTILASADGISWTRKTIGTDDFLYGVVGHNGRFLVVGQNGRIYQSDNVSTYTITFDSQGGSAVPNATGVSSGTKISEPTEPTKAGYTFEGWYKEASLDTAWDFDTDTVTANTTLFAKWTEAPVIPATYTVTFDSQGGSAVMSATGVSSGAKVDEPTEPKKAGYTFEGWYKETSYATEWNFDMDRVSSDITLYARWVAVTSDGAETTPTTPSSPTAPAAPEPANSRDGNLTLPSRSGGEVSLGDEVTIQIPAGATKQSITLTIEKWMDTQSLLTGNEALLSSVFEVLKNFPDNFNVPVKLTFAFDPSKLEEGQTPSVFYYDEAKKEWVEIGGDVVGNTISAEVDHFTKFAVLAVDDSTAPVASFHDIAGHWAEASIREAAAAGITTGYGDGTFKPNLTVTREEFTVMLMNALKPAGADEMALTFSDAAQVGAWAKQAVGKAVSIGLITGYADGTFRPDASITRGEIAIMIAKALKLELDANAFSGFADDADIPDWARGAATVLRKIGVFEGDEENRFRSGKQATRAEAVVLLLRMLDK